MIKEFISLVNGTKLAIMTLSILVDFILGVIVAVKEGKFELQKLADFVNTSVLYYIGGYFCVGILAVVDQKYAVLVTATFGIIEVTLVSSIFGKLKRIGIPIPSVLAK